MTSNEPVTDPVLTVVIDGQAVIEYDRRKPLVSRQQSFLDRMDRDMDRGIDLDGHQEASPDLLARARFVANSLLQALQAQNDSVAAATCAYLALRLPELKQVRIEELQGEDGQVSIEFVYDQDYRKQVVVNFNPLH